MTFVERLRPTRRLLIPLAICAGAVGSTMVQASPSLLEPAVARSATSAAEVAGSSTFGMFVGFDRGDRFTQMERDLGRPLDLVVTMLDSRSPSAMRSSAWGQYASGDAYLPKLSGRLDVVVTVPLAFGSGGSSEAVIRSALRDSAAGRWDSDYRAIAQYVKDAGYGDAVIRLGHEFDDAWPPYSARNNTAEYIAAFRHVHDVLSSESAGFRFDWTSTRAGFSAWAPLAYPGDAYVDVIGLDIYWRDPRPIPDSDWSLRYEPVLREHLEFARARNKPVSYPEWGQANGDSGRYVELMYGWLSSVPTTGPGRLLYQAYFSDPSQPEYDLENYPTTKRTFIDTFETWGLDAPAPEPTITLPAPPVTVPPVTTAPPATAPPVPAPPRAGGPVSTGEVLSLTHADVCTIVGVDVIRKVMGTEPDSRTGTLPESFGPSCIFTGNGGIGVQFHRYGPQGLANLATMQGKVAGDLAIAGRKAVVSEYSSASQQLTVWLGDDTDPALVVYATTLDGAVSVAEAVLARMSG